jgi:hypothetical protein
MLKKKKKSSAMPGHSYKPSTQETEAGRCQVQGQPGLHSDTLSQKTKKNGRTVLKYRKTSVNRI